MRKVYIVYDIIYILLSIQMHIEMCKTKKGAHTHTQKLDGNRTGSFECSVCNVDEGNTVFYTQNILRAAYLTF